MAVTLAAIHDSCMKLSPTTIFNSTFGLVSLLREYAPQKESRCGWIMPDRETLSLEG
jgi:hypothetical protein